STRRLPRGPTLFPYTTLFRSRVPTASPRATGGPVRGSRAPPQHARRPGAAAADGAVAFRISRRVVGVIAIRPVRPDVSLLHLRRSEEHTSEPQSRGHLVCRLQ